MNTHLEEQLKALLSQHDRATLVTCGQAGPQISSISYRVHQANLFLLIPQGSDHLFNLETQPQLVVLSSSWELRGLGVLASSVPAPYEWQSVVHVQPNRLHILSKDGQSIIETIDF